MRCIDELSSAELKGKRVLVRAGLDLPVDSNGNVSDLFRLKRALPTLELLLREGARVIVLTKFGRDPKATNEPVAKALKQSFELTYVPDIFGPLATEAISNMQDGEMILLENLQTNPGEIANDDDFSRSIAALGDLYVNDAFTSAHRKSAGMIGVPKFIPSYAGIQFRDEVEALRKALRPSSPSLAIIGGAKFETKEPVLTKLLSLYDRAFVGGAIANDFLQAAGHPIGKSLVSGADLSHVKALLGNERLLLPIDIVVHSDAGSRTVGPDDVAPSEAVLDAGSKTLEMLTEYIAKAKTILWNGPLGNYENGFTEGTDTVARRIAESGARSIVGGGDTIAAIEKLGVNDRFTFLSTGGGAMLEYLAAGTLPGIEALG